MTPPIRPEGFDAVGFVKEARKRGIPVQDIVSVLNDAGHGQYAKEIESATKQGTGVGPAMFEGMGWGLDKPILAGAGALFQKASGDSRSLADIYHQLKDDANNRAGIYRNENAGTALAANVAGGVLAGKANPMILGRATPFIGKALPGNGTWLGRAVNSGVNAAAQSGTGSLVNTEQTLRDPSQALGVNWDGVKKAGLDAGLTAGLGFGFGALASPAIEGVARVVPGKLSGMIGNAADKASSAVRNTAADALEKVSGAPTTAVQPVNSTGTSATRSIPGKLTTLVQQAAQDIRPQSTPQVDAGAARIISLLQSKGMTLQQVEELSKQADGPDILAELLGEKGIRSLDITRILGHTAPDKIRTGLRERAADEAPRWLAALERLQGHVGRDPQAFGLEAVKNAGAIAGPGYKATQGRPVGDADAAVLVRELQQLKDDGLDLWSKIRLADPTFPKQPTDALTVGQVQRVRQMLDKHIDYGSNPLNSASIEAAAQGRLESLRAQADDIAKNYGGSEFQQSDAVTAAGHRSAEAYQLGATKGVRAKSAEELQRLAHESGDPEAFRQGIASARQAEVQGVRDGVGGGFQNPFTAATGSPIRREITKASLANPADMPAVEQMANAGNNRLRTFGKMAGSQTAERVADMGEQLGGPVNPADVAQVATNPLGAAAKGLGALWNGAQRRVVGQEMDQMAEYLMAGAPGSGMTREQAIEKLKTLYPILQAQWAQQVLNRGKLAGSTATAISGRR